jgi:tetratricopeptide (TPR) repeat protein
MKIIAAWICLLLTMQSKNCFAQVCPDIIIEFIIKAEMFKSQGNYEGAIAEYSKYIKAEPSNAECYYRRGKIYILMSNYALAIEDFDKSISLMPKYWKSYAEIAFIYALLKDETNATKQYDKMCKASECSEKEKAAVKAKILATLQNGEFEKLTSQYTEYFLLFLKSF